MSAEHRDESEERLIHRLEAFSDIVIGFTLAEIALSLSIPSSVGALLRHPEPIVAFVVSFSMVCGMWWSHHRLFTHFFVPSTATIVLNFVTLGLLSFAVYATQLFLHAHHDPSAIVLYESCFGAVTLCLGTQYYIGWSKRRGVLPQDVAFRGLWTALRLGGVSAFLIGTAVLTARFGLSSRMVEYAMFAFVAYALVVRLAMRRQRNAAAAPARK